MFRLRILSYLSRLPQAVSDDWRRGKEGQDVCRLQEVIKPPTEAPADPSSTAPPSSTVPLLHLLNHPNFMSHTSGFNIPRVSVCDQCSFNSTVKMGWDLDAASSFMTSRSKSNRAMKSEVISM